MAKLYQRRYIIVDTNLVTDSIINEVFQTSGETIRKSIDETKSILSYNDGDKPEIFLSETEYINSEILDILSGADWSNVETDI
jgi:hypothetical protein